MCSPPPLVVTLLATKGAINTYKLEIKFKPH